jgi:DNA-binding transcriptional MocR family regulator
MRLNFSNAQPEQIREGIRRLSIAMRSQMKRPELIAV